MADYDINAVKFVFTHLREQYVNYKTLITVKEIQKSVIFY